MNEAALRRGTEALLARHETEPTHTLHVAKLALDLFDQLIDWHGYCPDERLLLEAAASLHDIGWSQTQPDGAGHHKASAKLIREHAWPGLTGREVELIALIARYHRKALPSDGHAPYVGLNEPDRRRVRRLAALLRVADGLDRRHIRGVDGVRAEIGADEISIMVQARLSPSAAIAGAERKADLLRLESGRRVQFR